MKRSWIAFVLTSFLIGLTGCNGDHNTSSNMNGRDNLDVNNNDKNRQNKIIGRDVLNENLQISNRAIKNVERLGEVERAHVVIRNNDAYVAVQIKNNRDQRIKTGTNNQMNIGADRNQGNSMGRSNKITGKNNKNARSDRNDMDLGTNGFIGSDTGAGAGSLGGVGLIGNRGTGTNTGLTGTDINRNNEDGGPYYREASTALEQRIAHEVRAADPSIHKVYISYDHHFINQ